MALGFYYDYPDRNEWRNRLVARTPGLELRDWPDWAPYEDIEYALVWHPPNDLLTRCKHLKAVISIGAGIDHMLQEVHGLPATVQVIRMADRGLIAGMTEYILMNVLLHHRRHLDYAESQRLRRWQELAGVLPAHRRIGFMGLGNMARPAAELLVAMGFEVSAWTASRKAEKKIRSYAGDAELHEFLGNTDILVALLPLTDATTGLLNKETLASLPEGAAVINAGRGKTVVETDLLRALDAGHISGASLDVFIDEPLPADNPLWAHPRVLVTPHVASPTMADSAAVYVSEVIGQIERGEMPAHVADLSRGY